MLKNKGKKLPRQPNFGSSTPNITDPWQVPSPVPKKNTVSVNWHSFTETYPLISPAGNPKALRLTSPKLASEQILLEDELKLDTSAESNFKQQLDKALTLLYWLETVQQEASNQ